MKTDNSVEAMMVRRQMARLHTVLKEECPYVDMEALGYWCGVNQKWWLADANLSQVDYFQLLRQLHTNEVPNITLRVTSRSNLKDLGVLGYAVLACAHLEDALRLLSQLSERLFPDLRIKLDRTREHALIICEVKQSGRDYVQILQELCFLNLWGYVRTLLPDGVASCASFLSVVYDQPAYHWQYQQILGCRVKFNQAETVLAIPLQWLYIAIQKNNKTSREIYQNQVLRLLGNSGGKVGQREIVSKVKKVMLERPAECHYKLCTTAEVMCLSPRTLRRYLSDAGTSFREVALEVKMNLAGEYLNNSEMTAQEIAYQLGYSQPTNFFRAFKAYFGDTPENYRVTRKS